MIRDVGASMRPVPAPRREVAPAEEFRLPVSGESTRSGGDAPRPAEAPNLVPDGAAAQVMAEPVPWSPTEARLHPALPGATTLDAEGGERFGGELPAPPTTRATEAQTTPVPREPASQESGRTQQESGRAPHESVRTPQESGHWGGQEEGSAAGRGAAGSEGEAEIAGKSEQRALAAMLAQADRVAQTLRVAHRPAEVAAPAVVSALSAAVGRVLRQLDLAPAPEQPLPQDALAVLVARGEASAHLAAPRVASTMPTPSHAAHDAAMQMWELPGEPGMVVRLGEAQLEVRLLLEGQKIQVRLRADDPVTQARLQEALPELKRALEKLPEVAAHGGHVDVRDESPGRERRQDQPPAEAEDDSMAEELDGALAQGR